MVDEETEVSPGVSVVQYRKEEHAMSRIVEEFDVATMTQGVNAELVEDWCYCFKQAGEVVLGMSVKGVQAAVREMSKHGEVARLMDLVQTYEDDKEVRLVGTAVRCFVNGDGVEVETDRSIRALRQPKFQTVGIYQGQYPNRQRVGDKEVPDPKWYEKAYSKAVRNILLPLIRPDAVSAILNAFKQTQKYDDVLNNRRATAASPRSTQQRERQNATPARAQPAAQSGPQADANQAADPRTIQSIIDVLKDMMQTMTPKAYMDIWRDQSARYGPAAAGGKQWPETIKLQSNALASLAELRKLRGDPSEEDIASMTTQAPTRPTPAPTTPPEVLRPPEDPDVPDEDDTDVDAPDDDEPDAS